MSPDKGTGFLITGLAGGGYGGGDAGSWGGTGAVSTTGAAEVTRIHCPRQYLLHWEDPINR
ncbi:hypothetical protein [Chryseobacterium wanjuense]